MAQQTINIGTTANDGTGDPLRTAFDKVNSNFTELYNDESQGEVNSIIAGDGISVDTATGNVTITNTITNNNQLINGAGYALDSDLTIEVNARISADTDLANDISTEASTRASADSTLEAARIAGDANLQNQIDNINLDNVDGSGTANYVPKWTDGDTIGNSSIFDNGTNVGIGTSSPDTPLNIQASNAAMASNGIMYIQANSAATNNGGQISFGTTSARHAAIAGRQESSGGSAGYLQLGTRASTGDITERMRIDSIGRVGIGTTSPEQPMHIEGAALTVNRANDDSSVAFKNSASNATWRIGRDYSNAEAFTFAYSASGYPSLTGNSIAVIDSSGDVSINQGLLELGGEGISAGYLVSEEGLYFNTDINNNSDGQIVFGQGRQRNTGGTEYMRIDSSGNVGIGTDNPTSLLTIGTGTFTAAGAGTTGIYTDVTYGLTIISDGISINTRGGAERLRIDSSGVVQVKNQTPTIQLYNTDASVADGQELGKIEFYSNDSSTGGSGVKGSISSICENIYGLSYGMSFKVGKESGGVNVLTEAMSIDHTGSAQIGLGNRQVTLADSFSAVGSSATSGNVRFAPTADNAYDLGSLSFRYDDIYATNATIQTSDINEKQQIEDLNDAELKVAIKIKGLIKKFKWNKAVSEKGEDARIHIGVIAQDVKSAFESEGLVAEKYGLFISSTWTDEETGEEKTRLGVRYTELLAFVISAL